MKFDELDQKMRVFETSHDHRVLPGVFIVARVDGRGFTRLTKETHGFQRPFDPRFRDMMLRTTEHLMDCGFQVVYGYTQSDEISLLMHLRDGSFGRKTRKYNSVLAGEASAKFSLLLGDLACFDCRVCELPGANLVVDYFRWRHEDAHRNALSAHCYWMLRERGMNVNEATDKLRGMSASAKNELLFQAGINFNDLPTWQKRGIGLLWEDYEKLGTDPTTGATTCAIRRRIKTELELPMKDQYSQFIENLVVLATAD